MQLTEKEFVTLINANQGIIHKVCGAYCQNADDKKDLFQEIVLQLWKSYASYRKEAKVSSWMYQIALNTAITQFRRIKIRPKFEQISDIILNVSDIDSGDDYELKSKALHYAINQLSEIEKGLILLYLEEYSNEEIGEIMGITQNNVRVKLHRIQEKIKSIITTKNYERA